MPQAVLQCRFAPMHSSPLAKAVEVKSAFKPWTLHEAAYALLVLNCGMAPLNQTMLLSSVEKFEAWMARDPLPRCWHS